MNRGWTREAGVVRRADRLRGNARYQSVDTSAVTVLTGHGQLDVDVVDVAVHSVRRAHVVAHVLFHDRLEHQQQSRLVLLHRHLLRVHPAEITQRRKSVILASAKVVFHTKTHVCAYT